MAAATRVLASAVAGSLMVVGASTVSLAQVSGRQPVPPASRVASFAAGALTGVVLDDRGVPVPNVVVSALGSTTLVATTDKDGRYEFGTLTPGPYLVRAHLAGYVAPRARMVQVSPSARAASNISLRRASAPVVLAAGVGLDQPIAEPEAAVEPADVGAASDNHSETAWRLRHARRSVLKDVSVPTEFLVEERPGDGFGGTPLELVGRAVGSPARAATSFFTETPFSGQVNLLATGSFDDPQELFSTNGLARNIAFARVTAPVGTSADWTVSGALTQADISSWIVAGSYNTRAAARHRYDVGMSYSTQRYDAGNLLTLAELTDGSRNAGSVHAYDSFAVTPGLTLTFGGAYARYDYLDDRSLLSPRAEMTITPSDDLRISVAVARMDLAPGAEEFLPPGEEVFWGPPQRTFSSINRHRGFQAEETTHAEVAVERDFGASTIAVRAFRQQVDDQLVTLFGVDAPGQPSSKRGGHYLVGNLGDAEAMGCSVGLRTMFAGRVHGAFEYSLAKASLGAAGDTNYLLLVAPSAVRARSENIHDFQTTVETDVPETATRVVVVYRLSNAFAQARADSTGPALDGRFDVQVRQSLPFMNFSNARWEMLLAVRNFFREAGTDQSVYDELLVVRPPKRVVGGVSLRF